jgi:hypothetical protein
VAEAGPVAEVTPGGCEPLRDADFEGAGEQRLRGYLAWIAQSHGAQVGITPREVSLAIARGEPKPGPAGVQVGEVSCASGYRGPYRVTLFRDALVGRPHAVAYHTLAHEFHHLVQIRRAKLACEAKGSAVPYEREAESFARSVVPACSR